MYLKVTQPGWATVLPPQLEIWIETLYILIENYHPDNRAQLQSLWCRWVVITVCINSLTAAKQNKECSNGGTSSSNATCSNNATCSSKARSVVNYWVFYQGLTTVAYAFILNGLAWWIVFAVAASATPNESKVTLLYMMCSIYQVCSIRRYMGFTKQVVSCPDLIWHFQYKMQVVMLIMIHAWVGFGSGTLQSKRRLSTPIRVLMTRLSSVRLKHSVQPVQYILIEDCGAGGCPVVVAQWLEHCQGSLVQFLEIVSYSNNISSLFLFPTEARCSKNNQATLVHPHNMCHTHHIPLGPMH